MLLAKREPSFGDQIGRYRLIAELARGGMGVVYLAATSGPAGFSKLVALKQLRHEFVENTSFLNMFLDEARLAARLNHPQIVQTSDVDQHGDQYFFAMEYLDGRSLHQICQRLSAPKALPTKIGVAILRDVLDALDYAHELTDANGEPLGFVHRDISPHNIFVTFDGHTKVIDFGISKARDSSIETKIGILKGRTGYMAPEQLIQGAERRSDLFSVGAILYELVFGKRLWEGRSEIEILGSLARGEVPQIQAEPHVPRGLLEICRIALSARPESRYPTARAMREALDDYLWSAGDPPDARETITILNDEFGGEREEMQRRIDECLHRLKSGDTGRLETIGEPDTRIAGAPAPLLEPLPPEPKSAFGIWRVAGVLGAVGALAIFALMRTDPTVSPSAAAETHIEATHAKAPAKPRAAVPAPAAAAPESTVPQTILLSVNVSPSNAKLFLDGDPLPTNPFVVHVARDVALHRVRAIAAGYQAREHLVSFAENVMLELSLIPVHEPEKTEPAPAQAKRREPVHEAAPPRPAAPPPVMAAPSPPPPRSTAPAEFIPRKPTEARRRPIDSRNPYGEAP